MGQFKNFTRILIDFKGHIELDKEDLKIQKIDDKGNMVAVDPKPLTADEIVQGIKNGDFYISFVECYKEALDGSEEFEVDYEVDEYVDDDANERYFDEHSK